MNILKATVVESLRLLHELGKLSGSLRYRSLAYTYEFCGTNELMSNVIAVESLTKRYGELTAVNNLTFTVKQGLCFGLLGPNGAGKTTTIEMLEGIVKPTSGQIQLFGEPASKKLYSRVGIQFQNTSLQDYIKVRETLTLFSSFYEKSADIDELVELCALSDFIDQDVKKLSGGQRQRMLLALALVNDPDLIFLDEPTTGLDPQARRNFWDLIRAIKSRGKSIVLTTHYMDEAQILCDDVAIMDKGIIIERGEPEELLKRHFKGALIQLPKENVEGIELDFAILEQKDRVEILTERVDKTLEMLMQRKILLEGMQIKNANLDDLFLKLTGHEMRS